MRFEPEIWDAVREICAREEINLSTLVRRIEQHAGVSEARTSAVRFMSLLTFVARQLRKDIG